MRTKEREKRKEDISGVEEISRGAVAGLEEAFDADNIQLIDYGSKEDEIFRSFEEEEENTDDLDVSKIYRNELEASDDEIEKIKKFEEDLTKDIKIGASKKDTDMHIRLGIDLNSDVGNDICKENLQKIYNYLKGDEEAERNFEQEIKKTSEFIAQGYQSVDSNNRKNKH